MHLQNAIVGMTGDTTKKDDEIGFFGYYYKWIAKEQNEEIPMPLLHKPDNARPISSNIPTFPIASMK